MFNANHLLDRLIKSGTAGGLGAGLLGGAALGSLGSKKGRKLAQGALKMGGIAAVGALAYHAYSRYKAGEPIPGSGASAAPPREPDGGSKLSAPPPSSGFLPDPSDTGAVQSFGVTLIRAMIAAARADGEIDATEGSRVFARINDLDLDGEEKAFLMQEFARPVDLDALVKAAETPELAAEVYVASLMAIDVSNQAESAYLDLLASRLGLAPGLVAELRKTVAERSGVSVQAGS